jgi:hypothetical protein
MGITELIRRCRTRLNDMRRPYRVEDADIIDAIDRAQDEAAERGLLLFDTTTEAVCSIAVVAGTATYSVDNRVLAVTSATLASKTTPLAKVPAHHTYRAEYERVVDSDTPIWFYETNSSITLIPTPSVDDTLTLQVYRYPLNDIVGTNSSLEIDGRYHADLIDWVCHDILTTQDIETVDPKASVEFLARFERRFGPRRSASELRAWKEVPRNTSVRMRSP